MSMKYKIMQCHSFEPPDPICFLCMIKMFKYSYYPPPNPRGKPLISFHLFNLQFCRYAVGDRLSPDHQRTILQRLLPYHPECEKKIGPGVDYITVCYPSPLSSFTDLPALSSHVASFSFTFRILFLVYFLSQCH